MADLRVSRRGVLVGAAVGGGLLVAWGLMPRTWNTPLSPADGEQAFGAWLKIARDGVVTVAVPQLEMGQGVTTLLPQVIATELGADWRQIAVEPAPVSGAYANVPLARRWAPLWMPAWPALADDDLLATRFAQVSRFTATAAGTTLAAYEADCRAAAASARAMLCMAAADRWDATWEECATGEGFVTLGDKRASFAELAEDAAEYDPPDPPPLRTEPPRERPLAGEAEQQTAFPRVDAPAKVDGSYLFAGDLRLPDMVYAAIRHGPLPQAHLTSIRGARQGWCGWSTASAGWQRSPPTGGRPSRRSTPWPRASRWWVRSMATGSTRHWNRRSLRARPCVWPRVATATAGWANRA